MVRRGARALPLAAVAPGTAARVLGPPLGRGGRATGPGALRAPGPSTPASCGRCFARGPILSSARRPSRSACAPARRAAVPGARHGRGAGDDGRLAGARSRDGSAGMCRQHAGGGAHVATPASPHGSRARARGADGVPPGGRAAGGARGLPAPQRAPTAEASREGSLRARNLFERDASCRSPLSWGVRRTSSLPIQSTSSSSATGLHR